MIQHFQKHPFFLTSNDCVKKTKICLDKFACLEASQNSGMQNPFFTTMQVRLTETICSSWSINSSIKGRDLHINIHHPVLSEDLGIQTAINKLIFLSYCHLTHGIKSFAHNDERLLLPFTAGEEAGQQLWRCFHGGGAEWLRIGRADEEATAGKRRLPLWPLLQSLPEGQLPAQAQIWTHRYALKLKVGSNKRIFSIEHTVV